ncbi:COG4315 family predicted lipoprotein [Microbaculum marinisediminis]|uniref:Lipoprotein with Yx(FWY)xxD motif n=1 Tax=Microbaculum marinisediminis TaxID=2931392 RepID=A0AAW5QSN6_9HYPH|nr:hypothetical protein [Microbaculum sp. A6E488]MCT8970892.1 hypothetical protein [Microbaculum sp. A6E488]
MRRTMRLATAFLVSAGLTTPALAGDAPPAVTTNDTAIGKVLADKQGMTLYMFDEDPRGGSSCFGKCAENWPPLKASGNAGPIGDFTIITRQDGIAQWAYKGKPLYLWVRDKAPGETSGDGVRGWQAARP